LGGEFRVYPEEIFDDFGAEHHGLILGGWVQVLRCRLSGFGRRAPDYGFRVQGLGFEASGFRRRVSSFGFRI
jgi:hypothetical protein